MAGSRFKELIDKMFLHNKGYDYPSGQWNPDGVKSGLLQTGLSILNPALGVGYGLYEKFKGGGGPSALPRMQFTTNPTLDISGGQQGWQGPTLNAPQAPPTNPYGQDWGAFTPNMPQAPTGYGAARGTNSAGFVAGTMDPTFGGGQYGQQQMMDAGYRRLMQMQGRERS